MRLILDHHYPNAIAAGLRGRGVDVRTLHELQWQEVDDETLLSLCAGQGAVLVTNNVADFMVITRRWSLEGRGHAGLILTSDARWPRSRDGAGALITALAAATNGPPHDWSDRIQWL